MDELISIIDDGKMGDKLTIYRVGIMNMVDKEVYSDEDIENISQNIKERFIEILTNKR